MTPTPGESEKKKGPSRSAMLGINTHRPARRVASRGGCDLCGESLDSDVHEGGLVEADGNQELERIAATHPLFERHKDGTLCSTSGDCKRSHLSSDGAGE